jgi:hypothetical protein
VAAIRINYPFQAGTLSGFRAEPPSADDPLPPNLSNRITAADDDVVAPPPPSGTLLPDDPEEFGPYAGRYGLGRQLAFGATLRPFRKLISTQALFRREVVQ